ncbi:COG3591 V8-like Glu-specific endopeptidase [Caulobacteraceae bacterium]
MNDLAAPPKKSSLKPHRSAVCAGGPAFDGQNIHGLPVAALQTKRRHGFRQLANPIMAETNGGSRFEPVAWEGRSNFDALRLAAPVIPQVRHYRPDERKLETRIGQEDRIRIEQTVRPPYSAIAHLTISYANGRTAVGTAWFTGYRSLATAAHNVRHRDHGEAVSILVAPGFDGVRYPFGLHPAAAWHWPESWEKRGFEAEDDYGVILLAPENGIGQKVGAFGFGTLPDSNLQGLAVNLAGYPADYQFVGMYYHGERLVRFDKTKISYTIDTSEGMSGSPVYGIYGDHDRVAIGIHTTGADAENSGRRIDATVYDFLFRLRL